MESESLTIALVDTSAGYEAKPDRVLLGALADFAAEVETFLRGESKEIDPWKLEVAVREGSFAFETAPIPTSYGVFRDLRQMLAGESLDGIDKKRLEMVEKWQKQSRGARKIGVRFTSAALSRHVYITPQTDYHADDSNHWVSVERYVRGELQDLGGSTKTNAHIRLPDGELLTILSSREQVRDEQVNRVYTTVMVRVKAKLNIRTGKLKDARLIQFVEYAPDKADDLSQLRRNGAEAWKDVGDASAWVDDLRGGDSE